MNANEVIARLANAHPNDHVNRSQSSNDVIPSAIHIAAAMGSFRQLAALELLGAALENRAAAFWNVMKIGRTHLQDATPSGWARNSAATRIKCVLRLNGSRRRWREFTSCRWAERRLARV